MLNPNATPRVEEVSDPAAIAATHMLALHALEQVTVTLEHAGVAVVPVKGIITARLLYPSVQQRPMRDVDLRVRPAHLRLAERIIRRRGWEVLRRSRLYSSLTFRAEGFPFDLETHVGAPFMCQLSVDEMLSRCTTQRDPLGFPHRHPDVHDHAILLAMNVYKDRVVDTAEWAVQDLERIAVLRGFDPQRMAQAAHRARIATALYVLASWLTNDRGCAAWGAVVEALGRPPRPTYARAMARALRIRGASQGRLRFLTRQASDAWSSRAAAVSLMAVYGLNEFAWLKQPR